ncbi:MULTISPECIES: response regulator [Brevibacillus]|jgi:two-component system response regulator YcbB|uniref:Transcriptional regulatory protein GlnL n=1 Tax=Brevibacillus parabrevis TaxID=54914 RepID=A0A4Y3PAA3_BREPA|nr:MULTISPECIES: response regulator [Brevibacillus]MBU8712636.1 DNA-binding domain-containing protein [Brevibacillus parabrevis]MDH6348135.1 two-component system response regulator YcbB [Brevibacillus sp. 1238]MDR5000260.1 response regulator [Brevibacillus parabrevis]MED1722213.1 response regulator [Brevibacillus parabrevis]MED2256754.1 response regulator [Brevibacillus parabrevis]
MIRFFLIEDDAVVRRMLERIIADSGLGEIVGQASDGNCVSIDQLYGVDVVLIDLLMPGLDGIQTIKKLQAEGFAGRFIMVSQVENKEMIGEAYLQGIDTFIQKPINRLEVIAVLKRVSDYLTLEASLQSIRKSLQILDVKGKEQPTGGLKAHSSDEEGLAQKARQLLLQLGIASEAGAHDLLVIMGWLAQNDREVDKLRDLQLKELYTQILLKLHGSLDEQALTKEVRAMEQRIRRMVLQAFTHLSSLGLTDYANPTFEHFAPRLFDFQEIRQRMQELEAGEKTTKCRISVKKFLSVFYMEAKAI